MNLGQLSVECEVLVIFFNSNADSDAINRFGKFLRWGTSPIDKIWNNFVKTKFWLLKILGESFDAKLQVDLVNLTSGLDPKIRRNIDPGRESNFKACTIFFDFQNAGRQEVTLESITGDDSLTEYCVWIYQSIYGNSHFAFWYLLLELVIRFSFIRSLALSYCSN